MEEGFNAETRVLGRRALSFAEVYKNGRLVKDTDLGSAVLIVGVIQVHLISISGVPRSRPTSPLSGIAQRGRAQQHGRDEKHSHRTLLEVLHG